MFIFSLDLKCQFKITRYDAKDDDKCDDNQEKNNNITVYKYTTIQ